MKIKQLSVFLENSVGSLANVTRILGINNINIIALSLTESKEFGILRMIVNNVNQAAEALKANNLTASISDVIGFSCPNKPDQIAGILNTISQEGIFIEYVYGFSSDQISNVILRPTNIERCAEVLSGTSCVSIDISR